MTQPEDIDLAKNFSRLSKILAYTASDIVTELHTPEREDELAGLLEATAQELRSRARGRPPTTIDMPPDIGDSGGR